MKTIRLGPLRIYLWSNCWGWHMTGLGYKNVWFLGFSVASRPMAET